MTSDQQKFIKDKIRECICGSLDKNKTGAIKLSEMKWVLDSINVRLSDDQFYELVKSSDACFVKYEELFDDILSSGPDNKTIQANGTRDKCSETKNKAPESPSDMQRTQSDMQRVSFSLDFAPSLSADTRKQNLTWPRIKNDEELPVGPIPAEMKKYSTTFEPPVDDEIEKARLGALRVSCWNVKSPELSGNILEMYPGWSMLTNPEQCELLDELMLVASQKILEEGSTLGQILGDAPEKELEACIAIHSPEILPLNAEKYSGPNSAQNVKKFFENRIDSTQPLDEFIKEWLEKPAFRWQYWKNQPVREFIAEDGSGGKSKENEHMMKVKSPIWDEVAWDLTLGVGDLKYGWKGRRASRCSWLLLNSDNASAKVKVPESGVVDYDFFKLAVWDLLLGAVKEEARQKWRNGPEAWDEVFAKTKKTLAEISNPKKSLESIIQTIASFDSDIVVLAEMSRAMIGAVPEAQDADDQLAELCKKIQEAGGQQYTLFKSGITDDVANTIVLTRRDRFESGILQPFIQKTDGKADNKNFGVKLKPVDGGPELQVLGVHLSGGGHNVTAFFDELELRLGPQPKNTIVAGDFNFDFRDKKKRDKAIQGRPLCQKLLEQSKTIWEIGLEWGTVSKKRTPLQAQVSKINLTDFTMKDFILISEDLSPNMGTLSGYISRAQILPDASCPSDHHPINWQAPEVPEEEVDAAARKLQSIQDIPNALKDKPHELFHDPLDERHELGNVLQTLKRRAEVDQQFKLTLCGIMELPAAEAAAKMNRHITSVRNGFLCEYAYKKSSNIHRKLVTQIVEVSSHTGNKHTLSRKDFKLLHEAVTSIVGPCGHASAERSGELVSWKPEVDFMKVDYNYNGELEATEVLVWLKQIAHVHRPWKECASKCLEEVLLRCRAKREVEKYELARELMNTMELYDEAYQEFLEMIQQGKEFKDLKNLQRKSYTKSKTCDLTPDPTPKSPRSRKFDSNCGESDPSGLMEIKSEGDEKARQPDHLKTYEDLKHHGQDIMEEVADFGEELRHAVRAPFWSMGPMKAEARFKEKIDADYQGDVGRILDMVRFSLLCKDLKMVSKIIAYVKKHGKWEVVRIKSGFDPQARCATKGGYRDVKINARNKRNGHIIEIQLHILMFYVIKQETGHKLYEHARTFDVSGITCADDILAELTPALLKEMASVAREDLEKAEQTSGRWSKKCLEKRMTLFDCLRLGRSPSFKHELAESAQILLNAVGEGDDSSNSIHSNDKHFHRNVMLMIGRAHSCELPKGLTHERLLGKVVEMIEAQSKRGVSCNIVLAQCKTSLANILWGSNVNMVIDHTQQAIAIYKECGLPSEHPVVLKTMKNLGSAWVRTGDVKKAIQILLETQSGMDKLFGFRDHRTAQVLLELGIAFRKQSKEEPGVNELRLKALWYLSHASSARRAAFGEEDERVANVFFEMALVKVEHQEYSGSMQDFETCMAIWQKAGIWMKKTKWEKDNLDILYEAFNSSGDEKYKDKFSALTLGYPDCQQLDASRASTMSAPE